ncbi:MAG: hypothetical protein AAF170_18240 [Bacteroidota bacterium]
MKFQPVLAVVVVVAFVATVGILVYVPIPGASKEALLILIGILGKSFSDVVGYYFGSSEGSARKQDKLDAMLPPHETEAHPEVES